MEGPTWPHKGGACPENPNSGKRFLASMARGFHPFPFRTRKLRPAAAKILGAQAPGKTARRQIQNKTKGPDAPSDGAFVVEGEPREPTNRATHEPGSKRWGEPTRRRARPRRAARDDAALRGAEAPIQPAKEITTEEHRLGTARRGPRQRRKGRRAAKHRATGTK